MSFTDMIKKSVIEGFSGSGLTTSSIAVTLGVAVALGIYIYFVYRFSVKSGFYNRSFNKTLATMPLITSGILLAMQSNLVISLGMVGALSIVRFRNAVKDASDLMYLFWSISMGIIVGANLLELAVLVSLAMTVLIFFMDFIPTLRQPCMLVISGTDMSVEPALQALLKQYAPRAKVRSRNVTKRGVEWIFELQTKKEMELMEKLVILEGIQSANLLTHDGDVRF